MSAPVRLSQGADIKVFYLSQHSSENPLISIATTVIAMIKASEEYRPPIRQGRETYISEQAEQKVSYGVAGHVVFEEASLATVSRGGALYANP